MPMGKRPKVEQVEEARVLLERLRTKDGFSAAQIGEMLGVSRSRAYDWLQNPAEITLTAFMLLKAKIKDLDRRKLKALQERERRAARKAGSG